LWFNLQRLLVRQLTTPGFAKQANYFHSKLKLSPITQPRLFDRMPQLPASEFLKLMAKLTKEELLAINGVGEVIANNYLEFINSTRYQKLIEEFAKLEQESPHKALKIILSQTQNYSSLPLSQEVICITGTFDQPRSVIKNQLEKLGAKVVDTVSSKTTILLAGANPGSKLTKAQQLGIRIVSNLQELLSGTNTQEDTSLF